MGLNRTLSLIIVGVLLTGCTSDPDAPINQTFPIRQMDRFFGSISGQSPPQPSLPPSQDYTHQPGYAPAYPPY
ncbi:MAG: hypothetical protein QOH05_4031 [Acetobacteraceae bacterium]|nr:hypothetical protein [Acetobacteraceae bacterium]